MNEKCPPKLGAGAKVWRSLVAEYQFRPDELQILEDACREIDLVSRLDAALAESTMMTLGSMGQPIVNPLVKELGAHRLIVKQLFAQLKIPDGEAATAAARSANSDKGRAVALARWNRSA